MISNNSESKTIEKSSKESIWPYYLAPCSILLAPLITYIDFHGHPFYHLEVILIVLGMLVLGLIIGTLMKNMGNWGRIISFTLLLEFSLDLIGNFDDGGKIICAIVAFLFTWLLRDKAPKILTLTFSAFIISTLILASDRLEPTLKEYDAVGKSILPPVIHLILDGHIGIEGIPSNIKEGRELKKELKNFYSKNGFHLFGNTYSHFSITLNSIPSIFNFNPNIKVDKSYAKETATDYEYKLLKNKYFDDISALGYKIKVYQSKYLDYCHEKHRLASCYTYHLFSTQFLYDQNISLGQKVWVLLNSYLVRSDFINESKNGYWYLTNYIQENFGFEFPFPWKWDAKVTTPVTVSKTLDLLRDDLQLSPEGTFYFAHLLTPHSPFIFDSKCHVYKKPISEWSVAVDPLSDKRQNSVESRVERYKAYFQQVKCVNSQLQKLFDAMRAKKIFDEAIIVIHGDHGSRIRIRRPILANQNEITQEDLLDSYSTLFAVKFPGKKAEYDRRVLSLNQAFSPVASQILNSEADVEQEQPYVYLRVRNAEEKKKRSFLKRPFNALTN